MFGVVLEQHQCNCVQSRLYCTHLCEHVDAVAILVHHLLDAADLTLYPPEACVTCSLASHEDTPRGYGLISCCASCAEIFQMDEGAVPAVVPDLTGISVDGDHSDQLSGPFKVDRVEAVEGIRGLRVCAGPIRVEPALCRVLGLLRGHRHRA